MWRAKGAPRPLKDRGYSDPCVLSQSIVTVCCHSALSLCAATVWCHCVMSLSAVTVCCHCLGSLWPQKAWQRVMGLGLTAWRAMALIWYTMRGNMTTRTHKVIAAIESHLQGTHRTPLQGTDLGSVLSTLGLQKATCTGNTPDGGHPGLRVYGALGPCPWDKDLSMSWGMGSGSSARLE